MSAISIARKAAKVSGACCALLLLAAVSSAARAQAGYVHEISGPISIQKASAKAVPAKVGDTIEAGTVFRSGSDGKLILKFADGQVVALGIDSALRVEQYRYVASDLRQSNLSMELMRGQMRVVTGLIGATNREGVHITAGNSIIGIQKSGGADFTVVVNPEPKEVGAAAVARGDIFVRTPYGPIHKIESGQYAPWQPGRTPPLPLPVAAAPAVIQAAVAGLWATVIPSSAPVVVSTAARMAVAVAAASQAQAVASADLRQVGFVDAVSSTVSMRTASGKTVSASVGSTFEAGARFNTGTDGRVVLKFADGQIVVLGPSSMLGVDQYQFDPRNIKASRSALDLENGVMRFVSGAIHAENHEGVSISAGASLVDILTTGAADFTVAVNTKQQEVGIAAVAEGEVSVHTPYGPISKIDVGQAAPWQPGQTPPQPEPLAAIPAAVQSGVTALAATAVPENSPVVVDAAARAALALAAADRARAAANADPGNARLQAAAQAAAAQADAATQAATTASQAVAATMFAGTLASLPATAAGPAPVQIATAPPLAIPVAPVNPTVTPGGGVLRACTGSPC